MHGRVQTRCRKLWDYFEHRLRRSQNPCNLCFLETLCVLQAHLRLGNRLESVLTKARLNAIAQKAKKRIAVGDISGAIKGAMQV